MARLRVLPPDTLTRVTEYVPEIVQFVERIIENGFAYESEGSVYFDTDAFEGPGGHTYPKLQPGNKGNRELLDEGEGRFTQPRFMLVCHLINCVHAFTLRRGARTESCRPALKE